MQRKCNENVIRNENARNKIYEKTTYYSVIKCVGHLLNFYDRDEHKNGPNSILRHRRIKIQPENSKGNAKKMISELKMQRNCNENDLRNKKNKVHVL